MNSVPSEIHLEVLAMGTHYALFGGTMAQEAVQVLSRINPNMLFFPDNQGIKKVYQKTSS